jgi:uncharacterized protein (TIGR03435 family)
MKTVARSIVLVALGTAVIAIPMFSQAPVEANPQFEVASIKVHPPPFTQITITNQNGRFLATGFSLRMLVGRGYGVPELRVFGGPAWVESERYDIEAKAPAGGGPQSLPPMIKALLEERFQLKAHKETRDLPVYELVVARGGSKLKLSEDQNPTPPAPPPPGGDARGRGDALRGGPTGLRGTPPPVGQCQPGPVPPGFFGGGRGCLQGSAIPLTTLTNSLQNQLGRPVIDKTGLTGRFDIKLEWMPGGEQAPGPFGPNPDAPPPPPADLSGPSIFTALQEQLGLRLESTKGAVEVVVIDSAEKPSEN